VETWTKVTI